MYDDILFPTDGSDPAESVLEYALDIASEHDATIHILNIADTSRDNLARIQHTVTDVLEQEGQQIVDEAVGRARERSGHCSSTRTEHPQPISGQGTLPDV